MTNTHHHTIKPLDFEELEPKIKGASTAIQRTILRQCALSAAQTSPLVALATSSMLTGEMAMCALTTDQARHAALIRSENTKAFLASFHTTLTDLGTRFGLQEEALPIFSDLHKRIACASEKPLLEGFSVKKTIQLETDPSLFIALARPVVRRLGKENNLTQMELALACANAAYRTLIPCLMTLPVGEAITIASESACHGAHRHPLTFGDLCQTVETPSRAELITFYKAARPHGYRRATIAPEIC